MRDQVLELVEQHIDQRSWLDERYTAVGIPVVRRARK
jgi:hypothetical protein